MTCVYMLWYGICGGMVNRCHIVGPPRPCGKTTCNYMAFPVAYTACANPPDEWSTTPVVERESLGG
eukprot:COSAG01_NODE_1065_length_11883_cov_104.177868_4_plen_66_part_00